MLDPKLPRLAFRDGRLAMVDASGTVLDKGDLKCRMAPSWRWTTATELRCSLRPNPNMKTEEAARTARPNRPPRSRPRSVCSIRYAAPWV